MAFLAPTLTGRQLTVDSAMSSPTILRNRIAALTDRQLIVDKLFSVVGAPVTGGGVLYSALTAADMVMPRDVEHRAPGGQYPVTAGEVPEPKLAPVEDFGGKFPVLDEHLSRNDVSYFDNQVTRLSNTIVRKVDERAIAYVESAIAALGGSGVVPGHDWGATILDGSTPTAPSDRPTADFAAVQLAADLEELGAVYDTVLVNPAQRADLATVYGKDLAAVLASAGLELFVSPAVTAGTAYAVVKGGVGTIHFEHGLTVEQIPDRQHRQTFVQAFVAPSFVVSNPGNVKKLTGLAGA